MSTGPTATTAGPLVTVILPTHDHASTVDLAAASVLAQSVRSLELVVIGDGATSDVKAALVPLLSDERVRFIDRPKTASRAEVTRHEVLAEATSPFVCYLGDDDIMLPGHLAGTLERLRTVDFTHPLPVYINRGGTLEAHQTDLAEARCRRWHQHPVRNAVSLTGVGHRLDAYLKLRCGWQEPPPDRWSDHYMWQQWFATAGLRYSAGDRVTVLKFEGSVRTDMGDTERRAEIMSWLERSRGAGFDVWLAGQAAEAFRRAAIDLRLTLDEQADDFAGQRSRLIKHSERLATERDALERRAATAEAEIRAIRATRTWRLRDRAVRIPALSWLARR